MTEMTDVTIHIDETLDSATMEKLRDVLMGANGVLTADYQRENTHLVVVEYDPHRIDSKNLLKTVRDHGLHAELVGL